MQLTKGQRTMALEIFKLVGSVFIDTDKANESLQKTDTNANKLAETFGAAGKTVLGVGAAIGTAVIGAGTAMISAANDAAQTADEIDKMSQKIGMSAQSYQEWSYIMEQNGMDIDKLQTGMKTLLTQMDKVQEGNADAISTFEQLGVEVLNADGSLRSQEAVMQDTIFALAEMGDTAERARLQTELFGKAGTEMSPMLNQGADAILDLQNRAHELGLVMSDEAVKAGVEYGDLSSDLQQSFGMLKTNLGSALFPVLNSVIEKLIDFMPTLQAIGEQLGPVASEFIEELIPPLADLAADLLPVILDSVSNIIPLLSDVVRSVIPVIIELFQQLLPVVVELVQAVLPVAAELLSKLMPIVSTLLSFITPILSAVIQLLPPLLELVMAILNPLLDLIQELLVPLTELLTTILTPLISILELCIDPLTSMVNALLPYLVDILENIIPPLLDIINICLTPLFALLVTIFDWLSTAGVEAWNLIEGFVSFITDAINNRVTKCFTDFKNMVATVWEGLKASFKDGVNFWINAINTLINGANAIQPPAWLSKATGIEGVSLPTIPMLAEGGNIEAAGRVLVGENGPELLDLPRGAKVSPLDSNIDYSKLADAIISGIRTGGFEGLQIVAPVYIGNDLIDTVVTDAITRQAYLSGGRA